MHPYGSKMNVDVTFSSEDETGQLRSMGTLSTAADPERVKKDLARILKARIIGITRTTTVTRIKLPSQIFVCTTDAPLSALTMTMQLLYLFT